MAASLKLTLHLEEGNIELSHSSQPKVNGLGNVMLASVEITKEVYRPGNIVAVLQIVDKNIDMSSMDFKTLLDKTVSLYDGAKNIAEDYIIYECVPEYKPNDNTTSLYVTLHIYSPEYSLTFNKYNQCHVAEKLGADIFKDICTRNSGVIKSFDYSNLQRIFIENNDKTKTEFIQPYLVQYEETALDFLVRVANTCGEFLFYENGTWQLGYKPCEAQKLGEKAFTSVSYRKFTSHAVVKKHSTNYLDTNNGDTTDLSTVYYGMKEEYLATLTEEQTNFLDVWKKRSGIDDPGTYFYYTGEMLKKPNLGEMLYFAGTSVLSDAVKALAKLNDVQDKWNATFIQPYEGKPEQYTKVSGKKVVCPLSNYNAKSKFGKDFFEQVRNGENAASDGEIHINFGTSYKTLLLGDVIQVLKEKYIVTKIYYTSKVSGSPKVVDPSGRTSIEINANLEVDAVKVVNDNYYPPFVEDDPINRIDNQVGIITANNDPLQLGRVQFRYSWQSEVPGKPCSPWVRIAQPFASKASAIRFVPQVGDEVMISYEYGLIDRPFMVGSLASETHKLELAENKTAFFANSVPNSFINDAHHGYFNNDFIIKSPNGQYIKFLAPSKEGYVNFVTSAFPGYAKLWSFLPIGCDPATTAASVGKEFSGGINIGDAYGIFNINLSTEKRKVLISSAMGDVQIDALTGITISAPNGNVKIEGKNVEIVAGNNLTLTSGANIDKVKKYYKKLKSTVVDGLITDIKCFCVDLSLVRCLLDGVLKPVGGTMLIKSKRYMRLEAGAGSTALPSKAYKNGSDKAFRVLNAQYNEMIVLDTVNATLKLMDCYEKTFAGYNAEVKLLIRMYNDEKNSFKNSVLGYARAGGLVQYDNVLSHVNSLSRDDYYDTIEDIFNMANGNVENVQEGLKLSKFKILEYLANNGKLEKIDERLTSQKTQAINTACNLVAKIREYKTFVNDVKKNVNGKVQADIIKITDLNICTAPIEYKNTIFGYMSKAIEQNNEGEEVVGQNDEGGGDGVAEGNNGAGNFVVLGNEVATGQNSEPTGVRKEIFDSLPHEITQLEHLGWVNNNPTIDRVTRRKIIYKLLQILKAAKLVTIKNEAGKLNSFLLDHPNLSVLDSDDVCNSNETWEKYLECVKPYEKESRWKTFKSYAKIVNNLGLSDLNLRTWRREANIYNPNVEGEILLSDISGNTCKINGEVIKTSPTSAVKTARDALKKI